MYANSIESRLKPQDIIEYYTHIVQELNDRLATLGSRRSSEFKDSDNNIACYRMRASIEGLLKKVSVCNSRLSDLEALEGSTDGTLVRSSVLVHKLTSDLSKRNLEINRLVELQRDQDSLIKAQSRKLANAMMLREQFAVNVTNSTCSGYINIQIGVITGTAVAERRFACLNFADLRIYDYTLSTITHHLLVAEHSIEISTRKSETHYIWKHKAGGNSLSVILPNAYPTSSKWVHSMDMLRKSMVISGQQLGPAVSVPYPSFHVEYMDDGSTVVDMTAS